MECCCHVLAGAPSCYLEVLFAAFLEPLSHGGNMTSLSLFYRYYFGRCSLNWVKWFHFLFLKEGLLIILIYCMIFLSPFLDVTKMSMSTVSFIAQLDSGILYLENALEV